MPAASATMPWITKALWLGGASTVMAVGVVVPFQLSAMTDTPDELPQIVLPADPERVEIQLALRDVFNAAGMVLATQEFQGTTSVIFWASDKKDRGLLNTNELLVISHNRVLHTLDAYQSQSTQEMTISQTLADGFIRTWRSRPDVRKQILAHGLQDVGLVWSDSSGTQGMLAVSLTWDAQGSDDSNNPLGELVRSSFTISLPGVQGTR